MKTTPPGEIQLRVPVKITYAALEDFARAKMIGERIETEDNGKVSSYAEILDIALANSEISGYQIAVDIKFRTLTTLFYGKEAHLLLDASLDFEVAAQEVRVKDYQLQVDTENWLMKKSLQGLAGTVFHNKIKEKMRFDFSPLIEENLQKINEKLEATLEPKEDISITGFLKDFRITDLIQGKKTMLAVVELQGNALVEIKKLDF